MRETSLHEEWEVQEGEIEELHRGDRLQLGHTHTLILPCLRVLSSSQRKGRRGPSTASTSD